MKILSLFVLLLCLSLPVSGQRSADYGVFAGFSSYIGDINPNRFLYSPMPAAGFFYRYNLHPRQSLRANIFAGGLNASDLDFNNNYQVARAASFSGIAGEFAIQFEFNFRPYTTLGRNWDYTPYIAGGAGVAFINASGSSIFPVIPFSAGFKVNIYKNLGLEAEYGFRKTFYDNFDGLNDNIATTDYTWIHNNDWYSFAGLALTWKIYNRLAGCPAYGEMDSKRKR
jgi:hypothetical protein